LGDRLEADRDFGQQVLREAGLRTAASQRFTDYERRRGLRARAIPARYVLKFNGARQPAHPQLHRRDGRRLDLLAVLGPSRRRRQPGEMVDFVLMEHLQGVEVGVGAYFDGGISCSRPASTSSTSASSRANSAS
jgi:phosphoribosylamine--glycine ligase